ncbi:MAG TPA: sigma factor-like helix-turn-helix DNA-binding protein, partial [Marinobacter sp.]
DHLGISRERVRQIEKGALRKLRSLVESPEEALRS